jgi:hypothetical protein
MADQSEPLEKYRHDSQTPVWGIFRHAAMDKMGKPNRKMANG